MIPKNVDCVIIGTGLTNSILAAACSRIGKSVLHVDRNNYYGEEWASFTFQQLLDWIKANHPQDECLKNVPQELLNKSRMFCIDLCPRLLFSNGPMVDLLVKSNVSRYHEFKNNIRILSFVDDDIHVMPCRRSDVFTSPLLTDLVDKRRLMKFIELCLKDAPEAGDEITANSSKPISKFLEERGLKQPIMEFIINSVAMVKPSDPTSDACKAIKNFMVAMERFGKSPFIFPMYGCGEFPQSFCRLSAVFGGIYCLDTQIENVKISDRFTTKFGNRDYEVTSDKLVMDYSSAVHLNLTTSPAKADKVSRGIIISKRSILPSEDNPVSFMRFQANDTDGNAVHFLEFNSSAMVCPPELRLMYLWTKSISRSAEADLMPTVQRIFKEDLQDISWKFFFQQLSEPPIGSLLSADLIPGMYVTSPPCDDIDYGRSIKEAEEIFHKICPDEEFLPRAPDPEEIATEV